ncbi:MAG: transglycosylase domain-containing protein, partial [Desulfobacterales bacterium]
MMNRFLAISIVALVLLPGNTAALVRRPIPRDSDQKAHLQHFRDYRPALVTTVYARDGSILGYFFRKKRFYRALSSMPPYLAKAFLAAEDKAFYEHDGIDPSAIFRAFSRNVGGGDIVQGGSTITQQLVKRVMLTGEKSYSRKIKEAILAYRLERHMTKDQILTLYLNEIFFGARAYGVEAAARIYFGKTVKKLTLAECALLAGLPKAPSTSNPFRSPQKAKVRQRYVLGRMLALGWITSKDHDQALKEKLEYKSMQDPSWKLGAYYLEEVRRWLIQNLSEEKMKARGFVLPRYGEDAVYESGLHVYTALSPDHQRAAEKALKQGLEESARRRGWPGPIKRIKAAEQEAFLQAQAKTFTPGQRFKPGEWTQVLVTGVTARGAEVRMGSLSGFISVRTMGWCRKPNPEVAPESVTRVKDARQVLHKGDVVWAKVIAATAKRLSLALARRPEVQGALISMDPRNGEVLALVGGYDFSSSQFNRATQAKRQPGSLFKPIVYSAAIDNGY